jgi:hypothetical protein
MPASRSRIAFTLTLLLCACQRPPAGDSGPATPRAPASPFKPIASVQDIMQTMVDPSSDALWDSVGTTINARGVETRQPRTDAEWRQQHQRAITLIEATNLLMMDGRRLVEAGGKVADQGTEGVLSAEDGQQKLEAQRVAFVQFAHALRDVGEQMLTAVDARDTKAMIDVGSTMDEVCEACHLVFWYPGQPLAQPAK